MTVRPATALEGPELRVAAASPPAWRWLGRVAYAEARGVMATCAAERAADLAADTILLLEHPPVYTLGRNTEAAHVPGGAARLRGLGADCVEADRGGSVTFHGPGQLVAYPVIRLADRFPAPRGAGDVGAYLRALEDALCRVCAAVGVAATRRPPFTGAWVGREKVAAIGVKLSHGVTQHGVALNITTDLRWFTEIVPCGISDGGVTSLERSGAHPPAGGAALTPEGLAPLLGAALADALGGGSATDAYPSGPPVRWLPR